MGREEQKEMGGAGACVGAVVASCLRENIIIRWRINKLNIEMQQQKRVPLFYVIVFCQVPSGH